MSLLTPWYIELGRLVLKRWRLILTIIGICILIIASVIIFRACKPKPKLNEAEIEKAEIAIQERNTEKLKEILAESDARVEQIDSGIKEAEAHTERVKEEAKKYEGMTAEELAKELEARK